MFEKMHRIGDEEQKPLFMIYDKECSDMVKAHFAEYRKEYTRLFDSNDDVELMANTFTTYRCDNYKRIFSKHYINNLVG